MTAPQEGKPKQVLVCASAEQLEAVAPLFPSLEPRYVNGGDWKFLEGRRAVVFGWHNAHFASAYAEECVVLPDEMPGDFGGHGSALRWAQKVKVPYEQGQKSASPQADDPSPDRSPESADGASSPLPPPVGDAPVTEALESLQESAEPPDDPIPLEAYRNEPEAAKRPRKRHLRSVFAGNTALEPDPDDVPLPAAMSEDHVADHFAAAQKDELRYVAARNMWLVWTDGYWKPDAKREVDRRVVEHCREALAWPDAASLTPEGKRKIGSKRFAGAVRDFTQSDRRIAAEMEQFERDPFLLGVPGGVVDLKAGKVIESEREHYIIRQTAVAPARGRPEVWLAMLAHICKGDQSLVDYMQRWCGYLICGDTSEECLLFCYGPTQRGKSKFVGALREMLGTYAVTASMDTFTESRMERHSEELAALAGARMIVASETEAGKRWNEARIKALTGRDVIRARMLHENSFEFRLGKIVIAGNHAPSLKNVDDTFRRRLHILEFSNPVPEEQVDRQLDDKLRAEYPQILQWCIDGFLAWRDCGLGKPEIIAAAVDEYLESEDTLAEWLDSHTKRDGAAKTLSGDLYASYRKWAEDAGEFVLSQKRFVQQISERGFNRARSGGKRYLVGLRLVGLVGQSTYPET